MSYNFIGKLKIDSNEIPQISVLDAALFYVFLYKWSFVDIPGSQTL